jgi:very-short-patch-repair endonuclease
MLRMSPEDFEKLRARIKASARVVKLEPPEVDPFAPKRGRPKKMVWPTPPVVPRPIVTLEGRLANQMEEAGLVFERQYRWCPGRKFRADYAFPEKRVLVELEGQVHRIKKQFHHDIRKRQLAIHKGWTMLPIDSQQVRDGTAVGVIQGALILEAKA